MFWRFHFTIHPGKGLCLAHEQQDIIMVCCTFADTVQALQLKKMCKEGAYWGKFSFELLLVWLVCHLMRVLCMSANPSHTQLSILCYSCLQELWLEFMWEWSMEWKGSVALETG